MSKPRVFVFPLQSGIFLALLLSATLIYAQDGENNEYKVKAAFLYNLARMIEWPNEGDMQDGEAFRLCFWGEDVFGKTLDTIKDKVVRGHPLSLLTDLQEKEALAGCHMVFISASEEKNLAALLAFFQEKSVLTVGDSEGFARLGCMVNLLLLEEDQRISIEINLPAAEQAQFKISSRLLTLAKIIK